MPIDVILPRQGLATFVTTEALASEDGLCTRNDNLQPPIKPNLL